MKNTEFNHLFSELESMRNVVENVEFWSARDLQNLFGYAEWRNFEKAIKKAEIACKNSSQSIENHFVESNKTIPMPKGAEKIVKDYVLTRYACYLIAQNGDSSKEEIAFAQTYFAVQTRKQEILEQHFLDSKRVVAREKLTRSEKTLSQLAYERGVDSAGFAFIRAKGDEAMFGGNTTQMMKNKLEIPKNRALADYLPTVMIKAKDLATEMTNFNIENQHLENANQISSQHQKNNLGVRNTLLDSGIVPENLPASEDVKKVKRRLLSSAKSLLKGTQTKKIDENK
jgi:DNA-damage-inducible protein D